MSDLDAHLANVDALLAGNNAPRNLDDHLATIDQVLAGEKPLYPDTITRRIPDGENSAIRYRTPPGTYDGAMDLKPAIDMSKFAMPILGQEDMNGDPVTREKPAPGPQLLGGRGMALMMNSSPPEDPNEYSGGSGTVDGGSPATLRDNGGTSLNSPVTPGTWGTGDLPTRAAPQGADIVSLLRGMFQGAL